MTQFFISVYTNVVTCPIPTDLNAARLPRGLHAGSHVDGVAPNVVVRFSGADHTSRNRTVINACPI